MRFSTIAEIQLHNGDGTIIQCRNKCIWLLWHWHYREQQHSQFNRINCVRIKSLSCDARDVCHSVVWRRSKSVSLWHPHNNKSLFSSHTRYIWFVADIVERDMLGYLPFYPRKLILLFRIRNYSFEIAHAFSYTPHFLQPYNNNIMQSIPISTVDELSTLALTCKPEHVQCACDFLTKIMYP